MPNMHTFTPQEAAVKEWNFNLTSTENKWAII